MQLLPATYTSIASVTKSDSTLLNCRAILVTGVAGTSAGNVAISTSATASAVTITEWTAGIILPIQLDQGRIMSTNTTATNIYILS